MSSRRSLDKELRLLARRTLTVLKVRGATLDIFLLSNNEMTRLKRQFTNKKTEPNVLAFPEPLRFPHPETQKRYLGEIYLNRDIIKSSPSRTAPLLLHGILHLLGHDHKKRPVAAKMERLEVQVLAKLGKIRAI